MNDDDVIYDDGYFRVVEVGTRSTAQHCPECNEWEWKTITDCACGRWFNDIGGIEEPKESERWRLGS